MFTFRGLVVAGLSLIPVAALPAQETGQKRERDPAARERPVREEGRTTEKAEVRVSGQEARNSKQLERYVVTCLKADNKGEVTIATLGAQRATNPDVKAFAQELVKDHSDFLAKLDRFTQANPGIGAASTTIRSESRETTTVRPQREAADRERPRDNAANRDTPKTDAANRDTARDTTRDTAKTQVERRGNAANPPTDRPGVQVDVNRSGIAIQTGGRGDIAEQLMQIKQEISQKCLATAQRELESKEGNEFDKCFVGMQIGAHMHMADTLSVLSTHVSGELQQILEDGQKSTEQHLEHAKQLAKKLEGSATAGERSTTSAGKSDRKNREKVK